ncbi:MAG: biopolymer transporter ExbD [Planctomycetia bacterium]|nr:biopolymer transporter ExbD [Planctomycetia bacterium]
MSQGNLDKCEPNFTPLLDLVLQLVMFFMLCANFVLDQTNVDIKLPKAVSAKALDQADDYTIYLNVNEQGKVILTPSDYFKDTDGSTATSLDNPGRVLNWLKDRAKTDYAPGADKTKDPPRSLIILRVHEQCPFEKTYAILKACRLAGYLRVQLRAVMESGP